MYNTSSYQPDPVPWSPAEVIVEDQEVSKRKGLVGLWFRLTAIPEPPRRASFIRREAARKSMLLSTVTFFLLFIIVLIVPATLFIPNRNVLWLSLIMLSICILSLLINRTGKTLLASLLVVGSFELAFYLVIASTRPFDLPNLPLYDMLVLPELLAASLLTGRTIFIVAIINSGFIWGDLILQPRTLSLDHYLNSPLFYTALVRPVVMQILVAVVVFIWVRSTLRAIERADKAEMLAQLEHALAEQKSQLELGIQEILQVHTAVSNGILEARAPLTQDNALWPLANALNILLTRFQRASRSEQTMQRIQVLLPSVVNKLQEAEMQQAPLTSFQRTNTPLDPLLYWLSGKMVIHASSRTRLSKTSEHYPSNQSVP